MRAVLSMLDVQSGYTEPFDRWYRSEHLPRVVAQPGCVRAHRYECTTGSPGLVTLIELDDSAEPAPVAAVAVPFRDESIGRRVRNYAAGAFRQVHTAGEFSEFPQLVNLVVTHVEPAYADAFDRWYTEVHVPEIVACPGWLACRRFRSMDAPATFLAMYELEDEVRPFGTPEYEAAVGWDEHVGHLTGYHGFRIYRHRYTVEHG